MLEKNGAASVTAIEANTRAFLKCLVVKELYDLGRCHFLCGDFREYLRTGTQRFDLCLAAGVLYHQSNPVELLELLSRAADKLYVWTHYFDAAVVGSDPTISCRFSGTTAAVHAGFRHTLHHYEYGRVLKDQRFCGGSNPGSCWLERADLMSALEHFGYKKIQVAFDQPSHANGPALALLALR
jgi:hypothetical protein